MKSFESVEDGTRGKTQGITKVQNTTKDYLICLFFLLIFNKRASSSEMLSYSFFVTGSLIQQFGGVDYNDQISRTCTSSWAAGNSVQFGGSDLEH